MHAHISEIVISLLLIIGFSAPITAGENPVIMATVPGQNALNVATDAAISATFDVDIDPATVTPASFIVNSRIRGPVSGSLDYDAVTRTAAFTPAGDYYTGDQITVQLSTGIQAPDGAPLTQSYNWSFTVNVSDGTESVKPGIEYSTVTVPFWPVVADLNSDGHPDAACVNSTGPNVSEFVIYINNGDGTFGPGTTYPSATEEYDITAADVDGDGDLDLVSVERLAGNISVMLNNGDGTFPDINTFYIGTQPLAVCVADFDGDGDLDLAVTYTVYGDVGIMVNNGDGTFMLTGTFDPGHPAFDILPADMNNDGFPDIVTANCWDISSISVLLNQGDGTFGPASEYLLAHQFDFMYGNVFSVADFDADGDIDIAAAVSEGAYCVSLLFNSGDGSLLPEVMLPLQSMPTAIAAADIVADGSMDILISCIAAIGNPSFIILAGNGDGTFEQINLPLGLISSARHSFSVADFDGDGRLDLLLPDLQKNEIQVMINGYICGDANFDDGVNVGDVVGLISYIFKDGDRPYPLISGDVNTDGDVNTGDPVYLINYIFKGGPAPVCE
jgi:hypothetical protein